MKNRKMRNRWVAAGLASVFVFGACTGCTDSTEGNSAEEKGGSNTLDILIGESWWPVDSFTGIIPEEMKKELGIDLNVTIAADANQLGLLIASNELPDIVFTTTEFDRLSSSDICYSYNELLEKYPTEYEEFTEQQKAISGAFSKDDQYYTILNNFNSSEEWEEASVAPNLPAIFYRKDIYEKLGSPKLETMDDLMNLFEMVKQEYPDMVPLGLNGVWKLRAISSWVGSAGDTFWGFDENGDVVYKACDKNYKEFLRVANDMARKGYFTAEAYANENETDSTAEALAGRCFAYTWNSYPDKIVQLQTNSSDEEAEWALMPKLGDYGMYSTSYGWGGMFVSKNCKNPEAAIKLITYLFSEEGRRLSKWGREGIDWTMNEETQFPEWSDEWLEDSKDSNLMNEKYNQWFYLGCNTIEDVMPQYANVSEEELPLWQTYKEGFKNYPEIALAAPFPSSDEGIVLEKLKEATKTEESKIIFAESDVEFEKAYDNYMDILKEIGVDKINTYMKEQVPEKAEEFYK